MGLFNFFFKRKIEKIKTETQKETRTSTIQEIKTNIKRNAKAFYPYVSSGNSSNGEKFPYGLSSSGYGVWIDHTQLLLNARKAVWDSVQAKSLVDRFAETQVDIGLKLEAMPDYDILKITPEQAEEWGRDVSTRFHLWAKSKKCHRAQLYNFYQAQLMYAKFQQRDNDIFTRLFYSNKKTLLNPLQFDFIDPMQIRGYAYTTTMYQVGIEDGIIRNPDNSEKSYKIWEIDAQGKYVDRDIPAVGAKSGKTMMLHGFQPEYAQQGRGYSRLGHALQEFQNITDFSLSVIKKAINQSSMVMGIENQQQDPSAGGIEDVLTSRGAGPVKETPTVEHDTDTSDTIIDDGERFVYQEIPEATFTNPGSVGMFGLQQGDTLRMYENKTSSDSYESFLNTFVSHLSASTGMPIEVLLMKFNANYSASRATLVMFWRIAQIWRDEMAADWLNPIYEAWLSEEIGKGTIKAPGWSDPVLREAWKNNSWIGVPMPNIDPAKEAKAAKEYLDMSATTQNRIARNLNGSSAKDNIAINKKMFPETPKTPWSQSGDNNNNMNENNNIEENEENNNDGTNI